MSKKRMETRIAQLQAKERAGLFERPPASGGGSKAGTRDQELEIAQDDIVARPVEPIPYARYVQIYKASAKRYGFADDWYVLAAVGKVESNHGKNMGPSGAGAMGPMQFLPSTWKEYGIDGNGDGVANIMDPEDAVPAAAAYLKAGGAPHDWYAALYTYNRAGWYVRKVLSVAEGYSQLAKDTGVEPYD
jgi:soluble lytic murein transglycosylase-like protein